MQMEAGPWSIEDCEMQEPTPKKARPDGHSGATPLRRALRDLTNASSPRRRRPTPAALVKKPTARTAPASQRQTRSTPRVRGERISIKVDAIVHDESGVLYREEASAQRSELEQLQVDDDDERSMARSIFTQIRRLQMQKRVLTNYLDDQPDVNAKMRGILVDWLTEIHYRLNLEPETLFLAVNYLDRYLEVRLAGRRELQLVGLAALFIASKCEEIEPIAIADLVFVCGKTYSVDEIIHMERQILDALQFNLVAATSHGFLQYYCDALAVPKLARLRADFVLHHTLLHLPMLLAFSPAELAAASLYCGQCLEANSRPSDEWLQQWESTTEVQFSAINACLHDLYAILHQTSSKLKAVGYKFGTKRFGRVARGPLDVLADFIDPPSPPNDTV